MPFLRRRAQRHPTAGGERRPRDDVLKERPQVRSRGNQPAPRRKERERSPVDHAGDVSLVLELQLLAMGVVHQLRIGRDLRVDVQHRPAVESIVFGESRDALNRRVESPRLRDARVDPEAHRVLVAPRAQHKPRMAAAESERGSQPWLPAADKARAASRALQDLGDGEL